MDNDEMIATIMYANLIRYKVRYETSYGNGRFDPQVDFEVGEPCGLMWNPFGVPWNHTIMWHVGNVGEGGICEDVGHPWACAYDEECEDCPVRECWGGTRCYTKSPELLNQAFAQEFRR